MARRTEMNLQGTSYSKDHNIIARAAQGPFECEHCKFWNRIDDSCKEKHIIDVASRFDNKYDLVVVKGRAHPLHEHDCCDFFTKK